MNCASSSDASMSLNKSDSTLIEGERRGDSMEMGDEGIEVVILGPGSMLGWVFVGLGVSVNSKERKTPPAPRTPRLSICSLPKSLGSKSSQSQQCAISEVAYLPLEDVYLFAEENND